MELSWPMIARFDTPQFLLVGVSKGQVYATIPPSLAVLEQRFTAGLVTSLTHTRMVRCAVAVWGQWRPDALLWMARKSGKMDCVQLLLSLCCLNIMNCYASFSFNLFISSRIKLVNDDSGVVTTFLKSENLCKQDSGPKCLRSHSSYIWSYKLQFGMWN